MQSLRAPTQLLYPIAMFLLLWNARLRRFTNAAKRMSTGIFDYNTLRNAPDCVFERKISKRSSAGWRAASSIWSEVLALPRLRYIQPAGLVRPALPWIAVRAVWSPLLQCELVF